MSRFIIQFFIVASSFAPLLLRADTKIPLEEYLARTQLKDTWYECVGVDKTKIKDQSLKLIISPEVTTDEGATVRLATYSMLWSIKGEFRNVMVMDPYLIAQTDYTNAVDKIGALMSIHLVPAESQRSKADGFRASDLELSEISGRTWFLSTNLKGDFSFIGPKRGLFGLGIIRWKKQAGTVSCSTYAPAQFEGNHAPESKFAEWKTLVCAKDPTQMNCLGEKIWVKYAELTGRNPEKKNWIETVNEVGGVRSYVRSR